MKLAYLTTDNRDDRKEYGRPEPFFGAGAGRVLEALRGLPDLEIHVVSCTRRPVAAPAKLADNVWFHSLHVPRIGWMRTAYAGCIVATRRLLRRIRPDVVHGQGTERDCSIAAVLSGFPAVVTVRGNMRAIARFYSARPFSYLWTAARLESFALPRAAGVICITSYTRRQVEDAARQTWLIPNAVNPAFFEVPSRPAAAPRLLCVGTICAHKNQVRLIKALDAWAKGRDGQLVFAGDGNDSDEYVRTFRALVAARPWCVCRGSLDEVGIREELSRSTLLVHPTLEDNCPNAVLEAMAAGVPVAAGAVGGVPDLVQDGVTGVLFDSRSEDAIARAVAGLLEAPGRCGEMGRMARQAALERFHPRRIAEQHRVVYREVIGAA